MCLVLYYLPKKYTPRRKRSLWELLTGKQTYFKSLHQPDQRGILKMVYKKKKIVDFTVQT